jgi:hypothetical protein
MIETVQETPRAAGSSFWSIRPLSAARGLLLFTLLLLPLHTQIFYHLVPWATGISQVLMSVWKELTLLTAGVLLVVYHVLKGRTINVLFCDLVAFLFLSYVLFLFFLSPDKGLAVYAFRVYAEPIFIYYLARSVTLTYVGLDRFFRCFFALAVLISCWAIFQAAALGDSFLINLGYETLPGGKLSSGFYIAMFFFQRAVGTFASPNTYGIYLQTVILLGIFLWHTGVYKNRKWFFAALSLLVCGLLYSFSRSAWLATLAAVGLFMFLFLDWRRFLRIAMEIGAVILLIVAIAALVRPALVVPVATHFKNTLTLEDPSTMGHIDSLIEGLEVVRSNPFGIGLGLSGPRALARSDQAINSESAFFVLAFDVGIPGFLLYCLFLLTVVLRLLASVRKRREQKEKALILTVIAIFAGQMIAWNLLPYIVELETTLLLFALLGIAHNLARSSDSAVSGASLEVGDESKASHARS